MTTTTATRPTKRKAAVRQPGAYDHGVAVIRTWTPQEFRGEVGLYRIYAGMTEEVQKKEHRYAKAVINYLFAVRPELLGTF